MARARKNYSGPVQSVFHLEDLDHDTLVKLAGQFARAYQQMDGHWFDAVAQKYGQQVARDMDKEVWLRNIPPTALRTLQALGHEAKDMAAILKVTQFHPAAGGCPYLYDYEVELKSPTVGIVIVKRCKAMRVYREKGDMEFVRVMCRDWDIPMFGMTGKAVIPNVKCRPLVIPPYDAPYTKKVEGVDCMWEYTIEPEKGRAKTAKDTKRKAIR